MTEIIPIFPTLIVKNDTNPAFGRIEESFLNYAYSEMASSPGVLKSNKGGWQSVSTLKDREDFIPYSQFLLDQSHIALGKLFTYNTKLELLSCWFNCNRDDNGNEWHIHPSADVAGCLWLKTTENSGPLSFMNPHQYDHYLWHEKCKSIMKEKYAFDGNLFIKPIAGTIILFPPNTFHKVMPNDTDEERMSIAFNLRIKM
jgi:uncharacterized protein (TIGR02466 family)